MDGGFYLWQVRFASFRKKPDLRQEKAKHHSTIPSALLLP